MTKKKPNIIWSIDANRHEYEGMSAPYSYYEIHKEGSDFHVMYYGVASVFISDSLDSAKQYVYTKMDSGKY